MNPSTVPTRASVAALTAMIMAAGAQPAESAETEGEASEPTVLSAVEVQAQRNRTVASPKFPVPLVDTPQTIAVVPSDVFNAQSATTLSDVLRNTPGITFAAGEGGNVAAGDSFFMRGFDASSSIFVDGVRDTGAFSRDTYNLEQVEIAKGPAGADTGRGGSSGYINLVTKTPHVTAARTAQLTYGGADVGHAQQRATIDLNQPVSAGAAVRVAAVWQDSGVPGREYVKNESWGVSPSLALGLGADTSLTLAASIDRLDNLPDSGLPTPTLPGANLPGGTTFAVDQGNFYGLAREDFDRVDRETLTAKFDHNFSGSLRLVNQTKWIDTDRDALTSYFQNSNTTTTDFNADTTPANPATGATPPSYQTFDPATGIVTPRRLHNQAENEILSNQTNLATEFATGRAYHSASVGLELSREEQTTPTWQPVGGPSTGILAPDAQRTATPAQTPYLALNRPYTSGRIDTAALYAFDTIQFTPRFLFNASLRWEAYEIDYEDLDPATAANPAPALVRIGKKDEILSWKAGVVYKPATYGTLYAAFANSSTPPGSSFVFSTNATNANNPNLEPQESRNYEAGIKWEFLDRNVSANLAFYRSENLNNGSIDAVTGLVTQDISQTAKGVEFGLSGRLTKDWLVFGGIGFIDTSYNSAGTTAAGNDGAELRFTPRLSGNLWTTYAVARKLTIGGGLQYTDSVLRSTSNTVADTATSLRGIPDYWLVNLMAAYAVNDHLTLRLNANNVFDEDYFRLNNNGGRYYPGTPRTVLVTADLKW